MPFNTTRTVPAFDEFVTVKLAGLMLLKPERVGSNDICRIGIHRLSLIHAFQVLVIVHKPDTPPVILRVLTGGFESFEIRNEPDSDPDFKAFVEYPFNRTLQNPPYHGRPRDYRWALNLKQYHPRADYNAGAKPEVTVRTGVLYTPQISPRELEPTLIKNGEETPLFHIAPDLAVAIPRVSSIKLSWNQLGNERSLTLPRTRDPENTRYTVALLNDPTMLYPPGHDELSLYYKVLVEDGSLIGEDQQYHFRHNPIIGTDHIPCMPTTLD